MPITPIRRTTLPDAIVEQIREQILSGERKPGDRLPAEMELARRFSVGRTSVREALKALAALGLISRSREGTFVLARRTDEIPGLASLTTALRESSISDLYEARKILEGELAALAAQRATEEDLHLLRASIEAMKACNPLDQSGALKADMAFHTRVAEAAQNPVLVEMFALVRDLLVTTQAEVAAVPQITERSVENHLDLYQAIESGDADRARRTVYRNLTSIEQRFLNYLRERGPGRPDSETAEKEEGTH